MSQDIKVLSYITSDSQHNVAEYCDSKASIDGGSGRWRKSELGNSGLSSGQCRRVGSAFPGRCNANQPYTLHRFHDFIPSLSPSEREPRQVTMGNTQSEEVAEDEPSLQQTRPLKKRKRTRRDSNEGVGRPQRTERSVSLKASEDFSSDAGVKASGIRAQSAASRLIKPLHKRENWVGQLNAAANADPTSASEADFTFSTNRSKNSIDAVRRNNPIAVKTMRLKVQPNASSSLKVLSTNPSAPRANCEPSASPQIEVPGTIPSTLRANGQPRASSLIEVPSTIPSRPGANGQPGTSSSIKNPGQFYSTSSTNSQPNSSPPGTARSVVASSYEALQVTGKRKRGDEDNDNLVYQAANRTKSTGFPSSGPVTDDELKAISSSAGHFMLENDLSREDLYDLIQEHPHKSPVHSAFWGAIMQNFPNRANAEGNLPSAQRGNIIKVVRRSINKYAAYGTKWDADMDQLLLSKVQEDIAKNGRPKWQDYQELFQRYHEHIRDRYRWVQKSAMGAWSAEEEAKFCGLIRDAVSKLIAAQRRLSSAITPVKEYTGGGLPDIFFDYDSRINFKTLAQQMGTRNDLQCRNKFRIMKANREKDKMIEKSTSHIEI